MKIGKQALSVLFADRASLGFLALLAGVALVVPVLNVAVPESSPLHLSSYVVGLIGKYLCYAILATAVDLIWGFCGILSLGHAVFFALGGYAMGMYLMRQIGTRGVYGDPVLPDFMVFLNWDELPWFWYGFDHLSSFSGRSLESNILNLYYSHESVISIAWPMSARVPLPIGTRRSGRTARRSRGCGRWQRERSGSGISCDASGIRCDVSTSACSVSTID